MTRDRGAGGEAAEQGSLPTYEELAGLILEELEAQELVVEDVGHELEPSSGERTFHAVVRLAGSEPPHRYAATLHFHWDALLTFVGTYGLGMECDLYHEEDEPCTHRGAAPHPVVELIAEYDLGEGGYQLHDLVEVQGWVDTVNKVLTRAAPDQDGRAVRLGLAVRDGKIWVDRFFADQVWYLDLSSEPDLATICQTVAGTMRLTPALADRLPL